MKVRKSSGGAGRRGGATPESPLERVEKQAAGEALEEIVREHLAAVMDARTHFPLSTQDLLSSEVPSRDVPAAVKKSIAGLHDKMLRVILEVARRIEDRRYRCAESAVAELNLAMREREKVDTLVQSDKQVNVSCQTLKISVEMFSRLNELLIQELAEQEQAGNVSAARNLILGNALIVYELTDFVIRVIERFQAAGFEEIQKLRRDQRTQSDQLRAELETLRTQAGGDDIDVGVRDKILQSIDERGKSIDVLDAEWDGYLQAMAATLDDLRQIHLKLPTLRLIRDNAKGQINLLEAVAVASLVKSNLGAIAGTIVTLKNLELASLTPDRVRRLMGIR